MAKMKCKNCKKKSETLYDFVGDNFCYDCLAEQIQGQSEYLNEAIELWINENTTEVEQ